MNGQFFNTKRFLLQLKRDIYSYRTMLLILYATMVIPYVLKILMNAFDWSAPYFSGIMQALVYWFYLFFTSIILSATSFKDFRSDLKAQAYLLLPSSAFEKFLSMWLLVFVLNPIAVSIVFLIVNSFFVTVSWLFSGTFNFISFSELFTYGGSRWNQYYNLLLQIAAFFAGGATFKRDAWLKTYLVEMLVMFGMAFLMIVTLLIAVKILKGLGFTEADFQVFDGTNLFRPTTIYAKAVYLVSIVVLWLIAYLKIKEKEV